MTDHDPVPDRPHLEYECLDPELGQQVWRLDDPTTDAALADRLRAHLEFCAHCRSVRWVGDKLAQGLKEGALAIPEKGSATRIPALIGWTTGLGWLAAAACLALVLLQAPTPEHDGMIMRGSDSPAITRPMGDEVLLDRNPTIRWDPIQGARQYQVAIEAVGSPYSWNTTTRRAEVPIPHEHPLPARARIRVHVVPVPNHLASGFGLNTSFRTGSVSEFLRFRWRRKSALASVLGWGGLAGLILGTGALVLHRRSS